MEMLEEGEVTEANGTYDQPFSIYLLQYVLAIILCHHNNLHQKNILRSIDFESITI